MAEIEGGELPTGKRFLIIPIALVVILWIIFGMEYLSGTSFSFLGVYPRTLSGIVGIFTYPLVHGSLDHILHNTWPLLILGIGTFYFYSQAAFRVLLWTWFISGLWIWAAARPSYHIGASGIIFGLASYIFCSGVISKYYRLMALSLVVVFLYGSMIWGIFPMDETVSFEGHLFGAIAGLILAYHYRELAPKRKKFDWEEEDEIGLDIEDAEIISELENKAAPRYFYKQSQPDINYIYTKNSKNSQKS